MLLYLPETMEIVEAAHVKIVLVLAAGNAYRLAVGGQLIGPEMTREEGAVVLAVVAEGLGQLSMHRHGILHLNVANVLKEVREGK